MSANRIFERSSLTEPATRIHGQKHKMELHYNSLVLFSPRTIFVINAYGLIQDCGAI